MRLLTAAPTAVRARAVRHPWVAWCGSRAAALLLGGLAYVTVRGNVFFDVTYYAHWAHGTLTGTRVAYRDFGWEYPPAALPAMLVPALVLPAARAGWCYGVLWVAAALAADAAVLALLLRRTHRAHPAVCTWQWGLPALGALCWARYDVLPAGIGAAVVVAAGTATGRRSGRWAGLGAALKLWPFLLAPVQRTRRAAWQSTAAAATLVAGTAAVTFALTGATGFGSVLSYQSRRGLQSESFAALPFLWLRHLHVGRYRMQLRFGAWEVVGPHVRLVSEVDTGLCVLALAGVAAAHWRFMRRDAGAAGVALTSVAVLLVTLLTDKVLSPQYLLWLLGILAGACVLDPPTWRPYVPWTLLACGLTAAEFPWLYDDVLATGWPGLLALTVRDAVMVGMTAAAARLMIRRLRAAGDLPAADDNPYARVPAQDPEPHRAPAASAADPATARAV